MTSCQQIYKTIDDVTSIFDRLLFFYEQHQQPMSKQYWFVKAVMATS